jgi:2-iminobutanoate/2-iminopropanoate deaminase
MAEAISTTGAPRALGPYSQAIRAGALLFVSGQIPIDPATGELAGPDIVTQTQQVLRNVGGILEAAGASFAQVARTTVYLTDLADFPAMNEVYAAFFSGLAPARSTVQVSRLPRDARIELDAIAVLP